MSRNLELIDLANSAGPAPTGVDQLTHIIASVPAGPLSRAAKGVTPSYVDLEYDQDHGGDLMKHMRENPTPTIALGNDILLKQQELSQPSRRLAAIACTLAFFAGGGVLRNQTINDYNKGVSRHEQTDTRQRFESDALVGVISGAAGGFAAVFSGLSLAGRLARRPAQKIARRAEESSTK
jgi:hypothetical protein